MPYTVLATSYGVSDYDAYQCQGVPVNDNDYSCHITIVEVVQPMV